MHLAVVEGHAYVTGVRSCQRPLLHLLHKPFNDRRNKTGVDSTAYYAVVEHELAAPIERYLLGAFHIQNYLLAVDLEARRNRRTLRIRLYHYMNLTELTGTARLLLMTIVGRRHLGDGLAIGDARREVLYVDLVIVIKTPLENIEMMFALTMYNSLFKLLGVFHHYGGVFEMSLGQCVAELLLVGRLEGLYRGTETMFGEFYRLYDTVEPGSGESTVDLGALQLDGTPYIARRQLRHLHTILAHRQEYLRNLLLGTVLGIGKLHTLGKSTGDDTEERYLAQMRLVDNLIREYHGRTVRLRLHLAAVHRLEVGCLEGTGSHTRTELHKTFGAYVLERRTAEYRYEVTTRNTPLEAASYLVLGKLALVEVELHERLVVLCRRLYQLIVKLRRTLPLALGNRLLHTAAVMVGEAETLH